MAETELLDLAYLTIDDFFNSHHVSSDAVNHERTFNDIQLHFNKPGFDLAVIITDQSLISSIADFQCPFQSNFCLTTHVIYLPDLSRLKFCIRDLKLHEILYVIIVYDYSKAEDDYDVFVLSEFIEHQRRMHYEEAVTLIKDDLDNYMSQVRMGLTNVNKNPHPNNKLVPGFIEPDNNIRYLLCLLYDYRMLTKEELLLVRTFIQKRKLAIVQQGSRPINYGMQDRPIPSYRQEKLKYYIYEYNGDSIDNEGKLRSEECKANGITSSNTRNNEVYVNKTDQAQANLDRSPGPSQPRFPASNFTMKTAPNIDNATSMPNIEIPKPRTVVPCPQIYNVTNNHRVVESPIIRHPVQPVRHLMDIEIPQSITDNMASTPVINVQNDINPQIAMVTPQPQETNIDPIPRTTPSNQERQPIHTANVMDHLDVNIAPPANNKTTTTQQRPVNMCTPQTSEVQNPPQNPVQSSLLKPSTQTWIEKVASVSQSHNPQIVIVAPQPPVIRPSPVQPTTDVPLMSQVHKTVPQPPVIRPRPPQPSPPTINTTATQPQSTTSPTISPQIPTTRPITQSPNSKATPPPTTSSTITNKTTPQSSPLKIISQSPVSQTTVQSISSTSSTQNTPDKTRCSQDSVSSSHSNHSAPSTNATVSQVNVFLLNTVSVSKSLTDNSFIQYQGNVIISPPVVSLMSLMSPATRTRTEDNTMTYNLSPISNDDQEPMTTEGKKIEIDLTDDVNESHDSSLSSPLAKRCKYDNPSLNVPKQDKPLPESVVPEPKACKMSCKAFMNLLKFVISLAPFSLPSQNVVLTMMRKCLTDLERFLSYSDLRKPSIELRQCKAEGCTEIIPIIESLTGETVHPKHNIQDLKFMWSHFPRNVTEDSVIVIFYKLMKMLELSKLVDTANDIVVTLLGKVQRVVNYNFELSDPPVTRIMNFFPSLFSEYFGLLKDLHHLNMSLPAPDVPTVTLNPDLDKDIMENRIKFVIGPLIEFFIGQINSIHYQLERPTMEVIFGSMRTLRFCLRKISVKVLPEHLPEMQQFNAEDSVMDRTLEILDEINYVVREVALMNCIVFTKKHYELVNLILDFAVKIQKTIADDTSTGDTDVMDLPEQDFLIHIDPVQYLNEFASNIKIAVLCYHHDSEIDVFKRALQNRWIDTLHQAFKGVAPLPDGGRMCAEMTYLVPRVWGKTAYEAAVTEAAQLAYGDWDRMLTNDFGRARHTYNDVRNNYLMWLSTNGLDHRKAMQSMTGHQKMLDAKVVLLSS